MALGYLISPVVQLEDTNGKPLTSGWLNVFAHGTSTPAVTYKDFDGNLNPNDILLDAKGMCIIIADSAKLFDVYCYDRNGVQQWSRLNVGVPGGGGGSGAHRLLRYYTESSEADENHPQGDWLHDLEVEDPDDPSGHPMVTAEQMFAWQADGQVFDLYEKDRQGGMVKWNAVYHQQSWRDQTDWWERYSGREGKSCRIEFWRGGMYSEVNHVGMIAYIRHINEDYMRLYQIIEGVDIWEMELQPALPDYSGSTEVGQVLTVNSDNVLEWTSLPEIGTITI